MTAILAIYATTMTAICAGALYSNRRALKLVSEWRKLYLKVFGELCATRAAAQVISLWEREEQAEEAWLS